MKQLLFILVFLSCCLAAVAQSEQENRADNVHLYGYVVTADSLHPIRNTHVISKMAHCGTITNIQGKFHIPAKSTDTLWVSCVGYQRRLIAIDSTTRIHDTLVIRLWPETITLREVTVLPYSDYETFKEMLITMPSFETPREIEMLEEDLASMRTGRKRNPYFNVENMGITASPLQFLYDKYNKSARRQNKLQRNRRMYNDVLREQGRTEELLPDSLDFSIDYWYLAPNDSVPVKNP
ncbi:MAG: carboxypeptidase-like regulatory domain-containing protein [Bacteroidales bacterium]|nr:carboxypeptidase-like regulatory domain-containing protein [Bacteroidales bacterium]